MKGKNNGADFFLRDCDDDGLDASSAVTSSFTTTFPSSSSSGEVDASHKSNLEKQADVLVFLRQHRSLGFLSPAVIYKVLGIDLSEGGKDVAIVTMLAANPKVIIEIVPDTTN